MMDNDFQKRLLATFKVETKERLAALSSGLIALEKATEHEKRQKILEAVFREAHSMKGAARAVSMAGIESLSHALVRELIISLEKGVKGAPSPPTPPPAPPQPEYQHGPHPEKPAVAGTVRISAGKLDSLLHRAEEMLTAKISARQRTAELDEISAALASWEKEWKKVRPAVRRLRKVQQSPAGRLVTDSDAGQLGKLLAFFDWNHAAVKSLENRVHNLAKAAANDRHLLDGMVDALLGDLKEVLMLPCSTVLEVLPKMVRDLARDRGKDAELAVTGETVEIDKRVLEEMKDPLIHLVRNCIDHGIEKPEERKRRSKPACGRITVAVSLIGSSRIEMVVADDGAGMDTAMLADVAVQQGVITRDEASRMGNEESLELIFKSGVSTSLIITDLSGRGLGLAIVREKVEKLGGTVTVISEPLRGTTFRMVLPLTLSTYRGVLVRVGEQTFIVPSAGVERVARIGKDSLKTAENRETVELDGVALSFVRLADLLQIPRKEGDRDDDGLIQLFLIGSGSSRIAFGVDGILGEQEVLVKSLGPQLPRVRNIAGATVLGTGKVATILHPGDLVKSAAKGAAIPAVALSRAEREEVPRKSVLIAEDSITARTLLKNILETAGYRTSTAVDGIDALTQLRTEQIDLVVSDVDMPRMNGFDLTAGIRKSREIADLPVVLVTSLDSREDRERGIEAGANAYIVKSSFDQSNLLEVIRRLI